MGVDTDMIRRKYIDILDLSPNRSKLRCLWVPAIILVCASAFVLYTQYFLSPSRTVSAVKSHNVSKRDCNAIGGHCTPNPFGNGQCHDYASRLASSINRSVSPCDNFYQYVCSGWKKYHPYYLTIPHELQETNINNIVDAVESLLIPSTNQNAIQKAAALYRSCLKVVVDKENQASAFNLFLSDLKIFWPDDMQADPLDLLVDLALNWDVHVWFRLKYEYVPVLKRGALTMLRNRMVEVWRDTMVKLSPADYFDYIIKHLQILSGQTARNSLELQVKQIVVAEALFYLIHEKIVLIDRLDTEGEVISIGELEEYIPTIPTRKWLDVFNKHLKFSQNLTHLDKIYVHDKEFLSLLGVLFRIFSKKADFLPYVWWHLARQFGPYVSYDLITTEGPYVKQDLAVRRCFISADSAMGLAFSAPFFLKVVTKDMIADVYDILKTIQYTMVKFFEFNYWLDRPTKHAALLKISKLKSVIAFLEDMDTEEKLNAAYSSFPNVGPFFLESFLKATRARLRYRRQNLLLGFPFHNRVTSYSPWKINALYYSDMNSIHMLAGILQLPFYGYDLSDSINFGALGHVLSHELTHSFDLIGKKFDEDGSMRQWWTNGSLKRYTERILCFKKAFRMYRQKGVGDVVEESDSEVLADWAGLPVSFAAYLLAGLKPKDECLIRETGYTRSQLFFIANCYKTCSNQVDGFGLYPHPEERCNVPLSHSAAFAHAFECKPGSNMNPKEKCHFW